MSTLSVVEPGKLQYDHIIGTDGIGSGIVFSLKGDHTLGRNESRMARLEPFHDYCKLHIVMHYVSILLGANPAGRFRSYPIGRVGSDEPGTRLLEQMSQAGMCMGSVKKDPSPTLYSVCYQYPDFSGGNITTENSASSKVSPEDVDHFFRDFRKGKGDGIVLAVPEVPLETRMALLRKGRERGYLNVASVLSSEVDEFNKQGGLDATDLLAVNLYEACSIADIEDDSDDSDRIISRSIETITRSNPGLIMLVTCGEEGSFCYQDGQLEQHAALPAEARSTAGAGDAFLAGIIAGMCCGLPLLKGASRNDITAKPLSSAVDLGTLLASLSVTSSDTIHPEGDAGCLLQYAASKGLAFSDGFAKVFSQCLQQTPPRC